MNGENQPETIRLAVAQLLESHTDLTATKLDLKTHRRLTARHWTTQGGTRLVERSRPHLKPSLIVHRDSVRLNQLDDLSHTSLNRSDRDTKRDKNRGIFNAPGFQDQDLISFQIDDVADAERVIEEIMG